MEPTDVSTTASISDKVQPHILLAEDNPTNQVLTRLMLNKLGHAVDIVADGHEAVEAVKRGSYKVVLMDVQMPNMSGLEATGKIRAYFAGREASRPYIIAVTASAERHECKEAGMDDYLLKPIRLQDFSRMVAEALVSAETWYQQLR